MSGRLGRLLFPPKCVLCRRVLESAETDLCRNCRLDSPECRRDRRTYPFLDSWASVWYYEGAVRSSILRYKFRGARSYADCYGRLLALRLEEELPDGFDLLTWVPTAKLRTLRRGYDQSALLAQAVGRELGLQPVRLLRKRRNNPPQSGIAGQAERRANVLGVYEAVNVQLLPGKRVLLLDDILTTGATAGECARVLLTAGASEITLGTIAVSRGKRKSSR